ncbi:unnamed protein product [Paramecium sonneborni]|uniref:Uncharacterized protein n=1 Tax=Paramecium sonneborni TaxID=65129 RepID=A0A8S1R5C5_9CILI|nr:unnamed protein product [Paramecium sonneborni]
MKILSYLVVEIIKEWICSQTITAHTGSVYGLSMNDTQNRVISCGLDQLIFTHNKIKNGIQYKRQMLIVLLQNMFYNDKIFTFQPISKEQMQVYKMGIIYKQFSKVKGFIVRSGSTSDCYLFPSQYIKQKCMVVNKKGYNVNLIRKQENEDFIIEQSIDFETFNLFGSISEDGEYLVTWDDKQKEIQIRKYQEK